MEDILIVSNYYPPEKGAAANRIEQLALKLKQNNYNVSVVCPLANYPKGELFPGYRHKFTVREMLHGIRVRRLWIYPSNSRNILKRIVSILSFAVGLFLFLLFAKLPKKVVVQSPPLMLSFLSVLALSIRGKKIILNVSDLWPLAAIELEAIRHESHSHRISLFMERFIYRKATVILGQSEEIVMHIREIIPGKSCFLYRNFPDHQTQFTNTAGNDGPIKLFYAGLLGVAQGVLEVCEKLILENTGIEFHIFGDGAEKNAIKNYIEKHPEKNITFHGMLERNHLIAALEKFDVALVPLRTRIYGSVPSKIFEYGALGLPILYFGGGEGGDIVAENKLGWVAEVGDFNALNEMVSEVSRFGKAKIQDLKKEVFIQSEKQFDLNLQIKTLIGKGVF
jgi:glycosyltransferase involved in cell wall biosynthesis